jgi:transporter family protein
MCWQLYAGITLLLWGLWGYLPKRSLATLDPRSALVWESVGGVLVGLALIAFRGFRVGAEPHGLLAALTAGLCGLGGAYFFLLALERVKVSVLVPFTSLYPLVTLALGVFLLGERPSSTQLIGIVFAVAAVVLLSMGNS